MRDSRLHGLSSEHHHALVLARRVATLANAGSAGPDDARELGRHFATQLEPHFRVEEEVLLPALRALGEHALVARTEADHAALRTHAAAASAGRTEGLAAFAEQLTAHVRFEERQLFPRCEARLASPVLDEVARRAPKN